MARLPNPGAAKLLIVAHLKIVKAHKGVYRCRISSHGKAVHSSTPGLGKNAILGMVEIISDLQLFGFRLTRHKHPDLGPATLAITQIKGGSSINTIPDRCEVSVDIRLLPEHHPPDDREHPAKPDWPSGYRRDPFHRPRYANGYG